MLDRGDEQRRLVAETGIDEALGDAGALGDFLDRDRLEAALEEQSHRGLEQCGAPALGLRAGRPATRTSFEFNEFGHRIFSIA